MNNHIKEFKPLNVIDTCAIWNMLSSETLYSTVKNLPRLSFCITGFVLYESLHKPRTRTSTHKDKMKSMFIKERMAGRFPVHSISLADLKEASVLQTRKRHSKGELSSMIFARKTRQAFLTDDQGARILAERILEKDYIQTTPYLFGHLVYMHSLIDSQASKAIEENKLAEDSIAIWLEAAYKKALELLLMERGAQ